EKWRRQIIGEISKKVAQIQNAGLGEFRIRDLNDEINKLLREKGHWEVRIKELGGPDYAVSLKQLCGQTTSLAFSLL
uniref:Pre-mRNA-splicing factor ISY1 homolog n=1 Tax=Gopherus evgoodei TaxID=1825980 RepID=A0A8C4VYE0_9SAUR